MNQSAAHQRLGGSRLKGAREKDQQPLFEQRLATNFTLIQELYFSLYPEAETEFEALLGLLTEVFSERPAAMCASDLKRLSGGNWYQSQDLVGMQLYVDRFCGDLKSLEQKLPYFESLGINFLHLMPLTRRPAGPNDGGYAVNSYTEVDPRFGTDEDLARLSSRLRDRGMFLMLDFVVNHTSDEYPWALKAKAGDPEYQSYYYTFPDRGIPDQYEASLPEIFPETSPGNFTWIPEMERWVMTVFNDYQWDLNYRNPRVFLEMFRNLAHLVNMGVDVVRFDALAFLWKKIGTDSQNLPEAHALVSLFRMCLQVVAPGTIFLAEAIVAPHQIVRYFGEDRLEGNECEIAYHATFMACLWNSVATKKSLLLNESLKRMPPKPEAGTWINYIRCHDDIGLGFDDRHIAALGWDPSAHRKFLLDYFCQRLDWSPAKGAVFMYNPLTGDGRITGTAASLLGLEKALEASDAQQLRLAMAKVRLLHGIILAAPGIPMIYAGDEIGMTNDYSYLQDPARAEDSRWLNRPVHDWEIVAQLSREDSPGSRIFNSLKSLIHLRRNRQEFADTGDLNICDPGNPHLFVFERRGADSGILVIANFDERVQVLDTGLLASLGYLNEGRYHDLVSGSTRQLHSGLLELEEYGLLWLERF